MLLRFIGILTFQTPLVDVLDYPTDSSNQIILNFCPFDLMWQIGLGVWNKEKMLKKSIFQPKLDLNQKVRWRLSKTTWWHAVQANKKSTLTLSDDIKTESTICTYENGIIVAGFAVLIASQVGSLRCLIVHVWNLVFSGLFHVWSSVGQK